MTDGKEVRVLVVMEASIGTLRCQGATVQSHRDTSYTVRQTTEGGTGIGVRRPAFQLGVPGVSHARCRYLCIHD